MSEKPVLGREISHTFGSKERYEALMASYLSGNATAEELVLGFFGQRRADMDLEIGGHWEPSADGHRWERLFEKLFWACEDVDILPDTGGTGEPWWIDRATFHGLIEAILPEFQAFQLSALS
jgi:hypothetical protein